MTQTRTPARSTGSRRPPRLEPSGSVKLTGRGAVIGLFAASLLGLLLAAWTGWTAVADALFVMSCGVVTYYTRVRGLRAVMVCPPLTFLAGLVCAELITAPDTFSAAEGTLVTLATSAPWLFTGTALTIAIAFGRGYRPTIRGPARMRGRTGMDRLTGMRGLTGTRGPAWLRRLTETAAIGRLAGTARHLIEAARHLIEAAWRFLVSRKGQRIRRR
jgi:hypothetical protein